MIKISFQEFNSYRPAANRKI